MAKRTRINGHLEADTMARYAAFKTQEQLTGQGSDDLAVRALLDRAPSQAIGVLPAHILALLYPSTVPLSATAHEQRTQELADIEAASHVEHTDFWSMLRKGLLREVRIQLTQAAKLPTADFDAITSNAVFGVMKKNRLRGSSQVQIERYVTSLMGHNTSVTDTMDIVYITRGIVRDGYSRRGVVYRGTKINTTTIAAWFAAHATELHGHHAVLGLHSEKQGIAHNRKCSRYWAEQERKTA